MHYALYAYEGHPEARVGGRSTPCSIHGFDGSIFVSMGTRVPFFFGRGNRKENHIFLLEGGALKNPK